MDQNEFQQGYDVDTYVRNLRNYRSLVRGLMEQAQASPEHARALAERVSKHPQPVRATVMTEDWCGDAATNLPVLASLFQQAGIDLRIFRGSEHESLKEMYESQGDDHIPVISLWDGDGKEIARWIEAPAKVDERKEAWKAERPDFMKLYEKQKTDKEAAKEFASYYRELLDAMSGWYRDEGLWQETTREVVEAVQ